MVRASIIIPAFNEEDTLPICVDSIIEQSEKSIEIIIVNDGSSDRTLEVAERFAKKDPRILVIDRQNGGLSAARNSGLEVATGDFLFFVDSDDWVDPSMVESMADECETTGSDVVIAGMIIDYPGKGGKLIHSHNQNQAGGSINHNGPLPLTMLNENFIQLLGFACNKVYRREWLVGLRESFDEGLPLYEDVDFNSRVLSKAQRIKITPQSYYHYVRRDRESLVTIRNADFLTMSLRAVRKIDSLLETWGVASDVREERASKACARVLWEVLNASVNKKQPEEFLSECLRNAGAEELVACALSTRPDGWREKVATFTIRSGCHGLGLAFVAAVQPIKRYKAYVFKILPE